MSRQPHKQLSMVIDEVAVGRLPDVALPSGYVMRAYRTGDAASWADTLRMGGFTEWTEDRVLQYLDDPERRAGSCVVEHNGEIVAATFASLTPPSPPLWMDVPSAEAPAFAGMTEVVRSEGDACEGRRGCSAAEDGFETRPYVGVLDFVVTHPDHRGKGLGRATCTSVAKFLVGQRGQRTVGLQTDDWRLPALHIYLTMGFKPVMNRDDMPERWAAVYHLLKEAGYDHS